MKFESSQRSHICTFMPLLESRSDADSTSKREKPFRCVFSIPQRIGQERWSDFAYFHRPDGLAAFSPKLPQYAALTF